VPDELLQLSNVETSYGLSPVLFGMSLAVAPGEMVTLMGRNGMGKTTTVRSIMGLTPALRGSIRFAGHEIRGMPAYRIAKLGIGLVPEGRQVFPNLTARENLVATAANRAHAQDPWTLQKVCALFPRLSERLVNMANQLSGGEQQMLAIGRALMCRPRLLLLDEPSLGLAPLIARQIFEAIRILNARDGLTVLIVEQNANHALNLAHRGYVMVNGHITMEGTGTELLSRPEIRAAYLEGGRH
jgi:branched-chain amino acid transport system ATP-binding protein